MSTIIIKDNVIQLLHEILSKMPVEICGFLLENKSGKQEFRRVPNLTFFSNAFYVAPYAVKRVYNFAEKHNLNIKAFIHSHFSTLELSSTDKIGLETTELPWIIVCLKENVLVYKVHYNNN